MGFNQRNLQPPTGSNTYIATGTNWAVPLSISDALNVFHDPDTGQDVIYGMLSIEGPTDAMDWKRGMGRLATTGSGAVNFQSWSDPEIILTPDDKDDRLDDGIPANDFDIGFQDSPVLKYNGMYLSLNQLLDANAGTSDIEFMSSRDGRHWKRLRKADYNNVDVLPRGLIVSGSYLSFDSRYIYTNASLVRNPGSSDTTITDDTLRIYYGGYGAKTGIGEAELPLDQIVGLKSDWIWGVSEVNDTNPNITVGMITLKPMSLAGVSTMYLNATTYTTTTGSGAGYAVS